MKMSDIVTESMEMTPQQRELAKLGSILMDKAPSEKDDALSNVMGAVGHELTAFGTPFGPRNLNDLVKKTGASEAMIKKLITYAQKLASTHADLKKDHDDGGLDDTDNDNDEFSSPSDDEIDRAATKFAKGK